MTARIQRRDQTIDQADTVLASCVRLVVSTLAVRPEIPRSTPELRTVLEVPDWRWKQVVKELVDHAKTAAFDELERT